MLERIIAARKNPREQAVGQGSEGIDVPSITSTLKVSLGIHQLLRRSIEKGIRIRQFLKPRHQALSIIRQENPIVRIEKDVSRLEITVGYPTSMKISKDLCEAPDKHP